MVPLSEMLDRLATESPTPTGERLRRRHREQRARLLDLVEKAGGLGNLLSNALQANLTEVSVRQNDDMRRISAWVAIWAVPTPGGCASEGEVDPLTAPLGDIDELGLPVRCRQQPAGHLDRVALGGRAAAARGQRWRPVVGRRARTALRELLGRGGEPLDAAPRPPRRQPGDPRLVVAEGVGHRTAPVGDVAVDVAGVAALLVAHGQA